MQQRWIISINPISKFSRSIRLKGIVAPSNAMIDGKFFLRCCIVNFRTDLATINKIPGLVLEEGRAADLALREG